MGLLGYRFDDTIVDPSFTGVTFVARVVSNGLSTAQSNWQASRRKAKGNGAAFMAVHVFDGSSTTGAQIATQANNFISQNAVSGGDFILLDVITGTTGASVANIQAWVAAVKGAYQPTFPNVKVGVYLDTTTWNTLNNTAAAADFLFIKDTADPAGFPSYAPGFGYTFHEYKAATGGLPALSTYAGGLQSLRALFGLQVPTFTVTDTSPVTMTGLDPTGGSTTDAGWLEQTPPPAGSVAETVPRSSVTTSAAGTSGTLYLQAVQIAAGQQVGHIGFGTGTTAGATMTHWWTALLDSNYILRATSADQTSGAIAASTFQNLAMGTPYVAPFSGTYFLALMIAASTMPTILVSANTPAAQFVTGTGAPVPLIGGPSSTGLTTPGTVGTTTYAAPTASAPPFYLWATP